MVQYLLQVTSLTVGVDNFDYDRRLFSAVRPVISPKPPEGPAQARTESYDGAPTSIRMHSAESHAGP